jgi:hypothetical protein
MDMNKQQAIDMLGGSVEAAAEQLGVTRQAVDKWPDVLPLRIADRVRGAWARKHVPGMNCPVTEQATQGVVNA